MNHFELPDFYQRPPSFTLQPVKETRERQIKVWKALILDYAKHHKVFIINLDEEFPLFVNSSIKRKLNYEAREVLLGALVAEGNAEWMDKQHRKCLLLWRKIPEWADMVLQFAKVNALEDGVTTLEEIQYGDDTRGTELGGIDRTVLVRALKILEQRGKAAMFKTKSQDDDGVKFFSAC